MGSAGKSTERSEGSSPTALLLDDVYLRHLSSNTGHPESPERLSAIRDALVATGLFQNLVRIKPRAATQQELSLVHSPAYLALVHRELSELRGASELSTGDVLVSSGSLEAALNAAGGVLEAVDAIVSGQAKTAFCAVRPPGHHATQDRGMGFCIFNNAALAARYVQRVHAVERVLIVDWDYHHGNGTQDIFYQDGSVFYFSSHHYGAYPGTGHPSKTGGGKGAGTTLNVPLPPGASDGLFLAALESKLIPAMQAFKPDFIVISAGFDAMRRDLLGCFDVTPEGFGAATRLITGLAAEFCHGRIVSVLEGGYRLDGLGECVVAHVRALEGSANQAPEVIVTAR